MSAIDLSSLSELQQTAAIESASAQAQTSLDLAAGLMRMVYFDRGANRSSRLLLVLHHLIVDGVSWRILLTDFGANLSAVCSAANRFNCRQKRLRFSSGRSRCKPRPILQLSCPR
ncbi:MAG: hypothetical protein HC895_25755 [Leptolyngbyaceae cyanobacterium SM1_3_5]|nr:hypothetical protein [Leptolyngbyaceae cyanobacterium SM1_3_5]